MCRSGRSLGHNPVMWLPCVQGRLGWRELCPGEGRPWNDDDCYPRTAGTPQWSRGLEGTSNRAVSLERKFRYHDLFWLLGLSLVAGQESLQSSLWWGIN